VDITVPQFAFSEGHFFLPTWITPEYVTRLYTMTGCTNREPWRSTRGFQFGVREVLFLGASGQIKGSEPVEITYKFLGRLSVADLKIGSSSPFLKRGGEYVWIRYADAVSNNSLVKQPEFAYVERVSREADFGWLYPWARRRG
jgi:hypothetical protein